MKGERKVSEFEQKVLAAPKDHVLLVKARLQKAYARGYRDARPVSNLAKAIDMLDTEPGWFLNTNGIYRDVVLDALRELAEP